MSEASAASLASDLIKFAYIYSWDKEYSVDNVSQLFHPTLTKHGLCYSLSKDVNVKKSGAGSGILLVLDINADEFFIGSVGTNLSPGASVRVSVCGIEDKSETFCSISSSRNHYYSLGAKS